MERGKPSPFFMRTKTRSREVYYFILLFLTLVILYLPALPGPKMSDDFEATEIPQLLIHPSLTTFSALFTPGNHIDYYPIRDLSFLLDVQLFKNKPISFRTHEILLMFLLVISLYLILLELKVTKEAAFLIVSV